MSGAHFQTIARRESIWRAIWLARYYGLSDTAIKLRVKSYIGA